MAEKVRWTYGELLRKRWNVSQILIETFVAGGLPVFDENDERFVYDGWNWTIDTYSLGQTMLNVLKSKTGICSQRHWIKKILTQKMDLGNE